LVTVACNDETSAADLLGRWLVRGGDTVWQDGPVTRAVREGAILYLDEVAEAREDVIVVLHPLSDHRRTLYVDRHDETLSAPPGFMLVASFNPGYRRGPKELKPSTRQRFSALAFDYPAAAIEAEIVAHEGRIESSMASKLVTLARKIRALSELALSETVSTRLLVMSAKLIAAGVPPRTACRAAIAQPLTDDPVAIAAMSDVIDLVL
jgi:nitric oxide reductase NorQ protein